MNNVKEQPTVNYMTLTEEYEKKVELQKKHAESIRTATDYTNSYIRHGTHCDSSDHAEYKMKYVKEAEKEFLEKHKKEILERAAEKCLNDI